MASCCCSSADCAGSHGMALIVPSRPGIFCFSASRAGAEAPVCISSPSLKKYAYLTALWRPPSPEFVRRIQRTALVALATCRQYRTLAASRRGKRGLYSTLAPQAAAAGSERSLAAGPGSSKRPLAPAWLPRLSRLSRLAQNGSRGSPD